MAEGPEDRGDAAKEARAIPVNGSNLEVRLLGPVEAVRRDRPVSIGGPKVRMLLALLAIHPGTAVSADRLIDELWSGEPPEGAGVTLRSYVSRLRAALGDDVAIQGGAERGYTIALEPDRVDAQLFEVLAREGLRSLDRSRHRRAAETLAGALAMWRGRPFADLPDEGALHAEAVRLEELRAHVLESRIAADLELGGAGELIEELERLVTEFPYRERLWLALMLALYRAGRQADALAAYHRARGSLDEDLGLEPGPELQELESAILRQAVPPPAGDAGDRRYALPVPVSTFIGRRRELDEIATLLESTRLVTLVGVGGVGKTRAGIEAGGLAATAFADGAAFVDLAAIGDPGLVIQAIATAVGVPERPVEPVAQTLAAHLRDLELLLVLDNCEHLRDACASASASLLGGAPGLRILATSREVLGVPGEVQYALPPLQVPDPEAPAESLHASESVALLLERAGTIRVEDGFDLEELQTAARICRELDGLPLAIELAAARTTALSLGEIADHLEDRFRFLVSWRRLTPARHRTLREAMAWSFDLLKEDERRVLASLSVFAGPFDRRAVAAVYLDGDEDAALRHLERLVEASLVVPIHADGQMRYRLLETVRQYAAEQLATDDSTALRRRHGEHVLELVEAANQTAESRRPGEYEDVRAHLSNIRAALAFAAEADPPLAMAIACALERFWATNSPREGIVLFTALLELPGIPERLRARAYRSRGGSRYYIGEFEEGTADYERALAIHQVLGEAAASGHLLLRLAMEAQRVGDRGRALDLVRDAAETAGSERFVPDAYVGEQLLADLAFDDGRPADALEHLRNASALSAAAGDVWWQANVLERIAAYSLELGRPADAESAGREALELSRRAGDRQGKAYALAALAESAAQLGRGDRAGRIFGAIEAEMGRGGPIGQWESEHDEVRARVRASAGPAFDEGYRAGRTLAFDAVVDEALGSPD